MNIRGVRYGEMERQTNHQSRTNLFSFAGLRYALACWVQGAPLHERHPLGEALVQCERSAGVSTVGLGYGSFGTVG